MAAESASTRPYLLLVEDDEDIRGVFEMVLEERYELALAETGRQALQLAKERSPDVVLLDWTLPDASGEEILAELRRLARVGDSLPVVIVSGTNDLPAI